MLFECRNRGADGMADRDLPDSGAMKSGNGSKNLADRRARRTRHALIDAWNHLVLNKRKRDIRVADVVEQAKVGRSTFYDHYSSADELHLEALRRPFAPLADAASGYGDEARLAQILTHFWDNRQRARRTFGDRTQRLLAQMVEDRIGEKPLSVARPIAARQLAGGAHSAIVAWLAGEASCAADSLAQAICRSGKAQVRALAAGKD